MRGEARAVEISPARAAAWHVPDLGSGRSDTTGSEVRASRLRACVHGEQEQSVPELVLGC